jgi:hypothetical protein
MAHNEFHPQKRSCFVLNIGDSQSTSPGSKKDLQMKIWSFAIQKIGFNPDQLYQGSTLATSTGA